MLDRRQVMAGAAAAMAVGLDRPAAGGTAAVEPAVLYGERQPFSFDLLRERAAAAATRSWTRASSLAPSIVDSIDYDSYQQIRFRPDLSLMLDTDRRLPVQLFHLGRFSPEPVKIHLVRDGAARELIYSASLFDIPEGHPARDLPDGAGFAGFRVMAPDLKTDWLAFLGASYFRTSGPYNQYGLSARGLAIDIGTQTLEEFPRFTEFWLDAGVPGGTLLTLCAYLDSPSVTGAYRFRIVRTVDKRGIARVDMEIDCDLYSRRDIARLGVAPFSSMFWYGEAARPKVVDWRPEIHDSDGLAVWTGAGERIWRPLNNPPRVMVNAFVDRDVKGFGLLQRDRDFVHYLDDSVFYERRASVWVEPIEPFGEGEVQLLEVPTDDEIHDNIAAYWCPAGPFEAGGHRRYRYRVRWLDDIPFPASLGKVCDTWIGLGGRPGHERPEGLKKFVVDFQGSVFDGLGRDDGVEVVVTPSRGELGMADARPVVDQRARWRALFDLRVTGSEPVNIRAYLRKGDRALTETWVYQYFPSA